MGMTVTTLDGDAVYGTEASDGMSRPPPAVGRGSNCRVTSPSGAVAYVRPSAAEVTSCIDPSVQFTWTVASFTGVAAGCSVSCSNTSQRSSLGASLTSIGFLG